MLKIGHVSSYIYFGVKMLSIQGDYCPLNISNIKKINGKRLNKKYTVMLD